MPRPANKRRRGNVIYRKAVIFFNRRQTKEAMTFLAFLGVSASFWVLQSIYEESDRSFEVEVAISGMPTSAVFTTAIPQTLKVTIHDRSIALLRYSYHHTLESIDIDFGRYADEAGNFRISGAELQSLLHSGLEGTTQITSVSPSLIDARFAMAEGRRVPVVYEGTYIAQMQYRCAPVVLTPDSVTVYAPAALLDTIRALRTVSRDYMALTTTVSERLPLDMPVGVKAVPDHVQLHIAVEEYVEKTLTGVRVDAIGVPDSLRLRLFPAAVNVSCNVNVSQYKLIDTAGFRLVVAYDDILSGRASARCLPVNVDKSPAEATHIRVRPDSVEYLIEETTLPRPADTIPTW